MKLSTKISGMLLIVSAIGATAVSVFTFVFLEAALKKFIGAQQLENGRQTMDKIDRVLCGRFTDIQSISQEESLEEALADLAEKTSRRLEKRMNDLTQLTGPWDLLNLVGKNGTIVASNSKRKIGRHISQEPASLKALEEALKGNTYASDYVVSNETGKPAVLFATPVRNDAEPGRPIVGAVMGFFSWPVILEIFEDINAHAVLVNGQGEIIGANSRYGSADSNPKTSQKVLIQNYLVHHAESVILPADQSLIPFKTFASVAPELGYLSYKGSDWHLILEMPTAAAFGASAKMIAKLISLFIVILVLMTGVVLFLMSKLVTQPIAAITQTTREIANGDLSKQIQMESEDEIGQLASSFNAMTAKLRESYEGLERKIEERSKELKMAQSKLLQSEKMSAVGQMASGIAHEVNNPLGIILGFAQGLASRIKPEDPSAIAVQSIEREAKRCKNFVQELLAFSRVNKFQTEPCLLNDVIQGTISLIEARTKVSSVKLIKELASDLPAIQLNRTQIQQVLVNLCNNAIDAMPKGGQVTIATGKLTRGGKEWAEIKVQDIGTGIPKEIQAKIFEPFFTTKEVGKGTGLGLSLVYEIVQRHNGTIDLESEPGKGTAFNILIPIHQNGTEEEGK